ncbi:MAG: hypothetical protein RL630_1656 [Verrucomicrobiota bacterium]|jgi:hypothetical protein
MINPPEKNKDAFPRSNILENLSELFPVKPVLMLIGTVVLLTIGYYFSLFAIHGFDPDFLQINKCVESGGQWNSKLRICEPLPGIYIPPEPASLDY